MESYKQNVFLDSKEGVITQDAMVTGSAHAIPHMTQDFTWP